MGKSVQYHILTKCSSSNHHVVIIYYVIIYRDKIHVRYKTIVHEELTESVTERKPNHAACSEFVKQPATASVGKCWRLKTGHMMMWVITSSHNFKIRQDLSRSVSEHDVHFISVCMYIYKIHGSGCP